MKFLYHASPVVGIETLEPRISNHGVPRVYFSEKRENTLVYLSNAIENFAGKQNFLIPGPGRNGGLTDLRQTKDFSFRNTTPMH